MPLFTRQPTSNTTPDPAQGGSAVTGNGNTGHGSTTASQVGAGTQTKSCLWTGFAAGPSGVIASVNLTFDWTEDGSLLNDGANGFRVQYSINGGAAWVDVFNHLNVTGPTSSSSQVALSASQDLTQVQVRDRLIASGGDVGDSASITTTISNIQLNIVTQDPQVITIM